MSNSIDRKLRYEDNTAFNHSLWDRFDLLGLLTLSRSLDERDRRQRSEYEYSYVQDGFYALLDRDTVDVQDEFVEKWRFIQTRPEFAQLQTVFNQNDTGRITATEQLAVLMESLTKEQDQEQNQKENNNGDFNRQEEEDRQQETADDEGQGQTDPNQEPSAGDNQQQGAEQTTQEEQGIPQPTPGKIGPQTSTTRIPTKAELQDVVENTQDNTNAIGGLMPYVGDEKFPVQIVKAKLLADRFDVKELAKYLGFAKRAVKGAHRMSDASTGEFTGYRNVEWDDRLHPTDLIGVATKNIGTLAKISEGTLRARTFQEQRARGRGPVILLRDESSSMGGHDHIQAQELELALANAFNADKRELVSIAWNHEATRTHVYGDGDATEHLSQFLSGGTVLGHALNKALEVTKEYVNGADILVLTDGGIDKEEHEERLKEYRKKDGRVWVIVIGTHTAVVSKWADAVITLRDIETNDKLSDIISQMNTKMAKTGEKRRVF